MTHEQTLALWNTVKNLETIKRIVVTQSGKRLCMTLWEGANYDLHKNDTQDQFNARIIALFGNL